MQESTILQAIPELAPDIPAEQFIGMPLWQGLLLTGGILLLLLPGCWYLWRRLHPRELPSAGATPLQEALQELDTLDADLPAMRECALRLSFILRQYLAGQVLDTALYETHEEFSQRMDSLAHVPRNCQNDTRHLLEHLAEFKYAGETARDAMRAHTLVETARELVSRIAAERQKEEEQAGKETAA